jgi:hypothetical protein
MKNRGEQKNWKIEKIEKTGKKIIEKTEPWKKPIKILKKPAGSVRFRFYKPKTKKTDRTEKNKPNRTEPNPNRKKTEPNQKKTSQTGLNRFLSLKTEPKPVGLNRFRFGFDFFI